MSSDLTAVLSTTLGLVPPVTSVLRMPMHGYYYSQWLEQYLVYADWKAWANDFYPGAARIVFDFNTEYDLDGTPYHTVTGATAFDQQGQVMTSSDSDEALAASWLDLRTPSYTNLRLDEPPRLYMNPDSLDEFFENMKAVAKTVVLAQVKKADSQLASEPF